MGPGSRGIRGDLHRNTAPNVFILHETCLNTSLCDPRAYISGAAPIPAGSASLRRAAAKSPGNRGNAGNPGNAGITGDPWNPWKS